MAFNSSNNALTLFSHLNSEKIKTQTKILIEYLVDVRLFTCTIWLSPSHYLHFKWEETGFQILSNLFRVTWQKDSNLNLYPQPLFLTLILPVFSSQGTENTSVVLSITKFSPSSQGLAFASVSKWNNLICMPCFCRKPSVSDNSWGMFTLLDCHFLPRTTVCSPLAFSSEPQCSRGQPRVHFHSQNHKWLWVLKFRNLWGYQKGSKTQDWKF